MVQNHINLLYHSIQLVLHDVLCDQNKNGEKRKSVYKLTGEDILEDQHSERCSSLLSDKQINNSHSVRGSGGKEREFGLEPRSARAE